MQLSRVNTVNCVNSQSAVVRWVEPGGDLSVSSSHTRGTIDQMEI